MNFKFKWMRGSKRIKGAKAKTYTLRKADVGKRIQVVVTGSLTGYTSATAKSKKTAKVVPKD